MPRCRRLRPLKNDNKNPWGNSPTGFLLEEGGSNAKALLKGELSAKLTERFMFAGKPLRLPFGHPPPLLGEALKRAGNARPYEGCRRAGRVSGPYIVGNGLDRSEITPHPSFASQIKLLKISTQTHIIYECCGNGFSARQSMKGKVPINEASENLRHFCRRFSL